MVEFLVIVNFSDFGGDILEPGVYGSGAAGASARHIMEGNPACVQCGGPAEVTIDFDALGELSQLAVCTGCYGIVRAVIVAQMEDRGQVDTVNTFSSNGLGRA